MHQMQTIITNDHGVCPSVTRLNWALRVELFGAAFAKSLRPLLLFVIIVLIIRELVLFVSDSGVFLCLLLPARMRRAGIVCGVSVCPPKISKTTDQKLV